MVCSFLAFQCPYKIASILTNCCQCVSPISYESRSRTNPERLAVIEAMLKMTDELFDGTMTVNDFQNSVADRQQDVRDSHANSCFTLFGTKSRLAEAIEKEYPSPDLEPGAPIPGH